MPLKSKSSMSLSAILFDLDDTLYLERHFVFSGFRSVAAVLERECGAEREQLWHQMVELFEDGERQLRAGLGGHYERLAAVERAWDPDGVFRLLRDPTPGERAA